MAQDSVPNTSIENTHDARNHLQDAAEATAVAAEGSEPAPQPAQGFSISFPPPDAAANDDGLVEHITALINRVYLETEASFWTPGFERTNTDEIRDHLRRGALALAWRGSDGSFNEHDSRNLETDLMGCISVKSFPEESVGEFGMLACDPAWRGAGVGRALVRFAEAEAARRGARRMRLELLQGDGWRHEFKDRLEAWYGREGYRLVAVEDVRAKWAVLAPRLARPTVMKVFVKELTGLTQ